MKGIPQQKTHLTATLYIPHGSDESTHLNHPLSSMKNFISHMVQMKVLYLCKRFHFIWIFISHMVQMKGSLKGVHMIYLYYFISHMVQMKGPLAMPRKTDFIKFISHMVQMKVMQSYRLSFQQIRLYPTWFRWKKNFLCLWAGIITRFISHMVQMKVSYCLSASLEASAFISHMVQMKGPLMS